MFSYWRESYWNINNFKIKQNICVHFKIYKKTATVTTVLAKKFQTANNSEKGTYVFAFEEEIRHSRSSKARQRLDIARVHQQPSTLGEDAQGQGPHVVAVSVAFSRLS